MSFSRQVDFEKDIVLNIPHQFYPFLEPAPFKISWGGRGGAKSQTIAIILVYLGFREKKKIMCAREFQSTLKESSKATIEEAISILGLQWFYTVQENEIIGRNGTSFIFKGLRLNVGSLNSIIGVDICWLEEAQYNSKVSINALFPTIRKKGSEIWVSMNPRKKEDVIYSMFLTGDPPPGTVIVHVNYYDNPWFGETSLVRQMEWDKARDPAKYRHVWLGELESKSERIVFSNWRVARLEIPENAIPLYGLDFGFSVDPTVLIQLYLFDEDRLLYIRKEAYKHKLEIDNMPDYFLDQIPESRFGKIIADSARPELISHLRRLNWRIQPSIKGRNSVLEGVEFMRSHDIVVDPDCKNTEYELGHFSYDQDKDENILPNVLDENNHCIDAARYGLEATRRGQMKITSRQIPN